MMRSQGCKRSRDDVDFDLNPDSPDIFDNSKRPRNETFNTLPFRMPGTPPSSRSNSISTQNSPQKHIPVPPALCFATASPQRDRDIDMNMNMMLDSPAAAGLGSESFANPFLRPPDHYLHSPALNHRRVPTPIHSHFLSCGSLRQLGDGGLSSVDLEDPHSGLLGPYGTTKEREERERRMPSPISEDEMDFGDTMGSLTPTIPGMQSRLSRLSVATADEAMELDNRTLEMPAPPAVREEENAGMGMLGVPPRKGRARSGAMTAGSTGKRFVMGYRDDCEKCRARVPGHFSHII